MNNLYAVQRVYSDDLQHYGVLGMKWGVRRYQNYDGSYTRKGLEHYRNAEHQREVADRHYKQSKADYKAGKITKSDLQRARNTRKLAKMQQEHTYKQLKKDYLGDQGKALYQSGKTITGNERRTAIIGTVLE